MNGKTNLTRISSSQLVFGYANLLSALMGLVRFFSLVGLSAICFFFSIGLIGVGSYFMLTPSKKSPTDTEIATEMIVRDSVVIWGLSGIIYLINSYLIFGTNMGWVYLVLSIPAFALSIIFYIILCWTLFTQETEEEEL